MTRMDERVDVLRERVEGYQHLNEERWKFHNTLHTDLTEGLKAVREEAGDWRTAATELRAEFISRSEYQSEHRALAAEMGSKIDSHVTTSEGRFIALEGRMGQVETTQKLAAERDTTTRDLFANARNLILLVLSIIGGLITVAIFLGK